ncbi:MAG: START domain-containing protein [Agitococcus sp.]|nr:START domain-containing protein [Agitococcus sp.]
MLKKLCLSLMIASVPAIALAERDLDDFRAEAAKNEWRLSKSDKLHQIKVYVKNEEGKNIRSFRVEAMIDAPIEVVARVQSDVDNYVRWYFATLEAKLLKKVSDKEFIFYMVHDAPIGMPDRDVVLKATIEPMTGKKPYVVIKMVSIPDFIPARPPFVRMTAENYVVKFTPQGKDKTLLESEGFIDPGGVSPSWAINYIQGKGPYTNMMGMQRMVNLPLYRDGKTPLPFTFIE